MKYNQNPNFLNQSKGNLSLKCDSSPAFNAGMYYAGVPSNDILDIARSGSPDLGSFEYYLNDITLNQTLLPNQDPSYFGKDIFVSNIIQNSNRVLIEGTESINLSNGFLIAPTIVAESVFEVKIKSD
jgi:hypothetical protein